MSPWLIPTTGWPGLTLELVARLATAQTTVALAAAGASLLFSLIVVRWRARSRPRRRSAS